MLFPHDFIKVLQSLESTCHGHSAVAFKGCSRRDGITCPVVCEYSGEVIWMRRILDQYHKAAKEKNVRIVHCCGFDSIPSDLGTCLIVDHLNKLGKYAL